MSLLLLVLSCQKDNNVAKTSIDNIEKEEDNFKYDSVDLKLYEPKEELYSILDSVIADSSTDNRTISQKKLIYLFEVINGYEEDVAITYTEICGLEMSYFKACFIYKDNVFLYTGKFDSKLVYDRNKTFNYKYIICDDKDDRSRSWSYKYINNKLTLTIISNDAPKEYNFEFNYW